MDRCNIQIASSELLDVFDSLEACCVLALVWWARLSIRFNCARCKVIPWLHIWVICCLFNSFFDCPLHIREFASCRFTFSSHSHRTLLLFLLLFLVDEITDENLFIALFLFLLKTVIMLQRVSFELNDMVKYYSLLLSSLLIDIKYGRSSPWRTLSMLDQVLIIVSILVSSKSLRLQAIIMTDRGSCEVKGACLRLYFCDIIQSLIYHAELAPWLESRVALFLVS